MVSLYHLIKLNYKALIKNWVSFIWGLLLPVIMLFMNKNNIYQESDLVYWWVYMCVTFFIYGVGIQALVERETGYLSVIFSIKWIPIQFFIALLLTQIFYILVTFFIFNTIILIIYPFNIIKVLEYSLLSLVLSIPIAAISYNLTYFTKSFSTTLTSVINIFLFLSFLLMNSQTFFDYINPLKLISYYVFKVIHGDSIYMFCLISLLMICISIPSILSFSPLSFERR